MKLKLIGPKAFELDKLRLKASKDVYTGSNLVVFTYNASLKPDCPACTALDSVTGSDEFKSKVANWRHKKVLKMGKILCNNAKQNTDLCERFSAVVGVGDNFSPVNAIKPTVFVEGSRPMKMKPAADGYAGNVLVLFTQESSAEAPPCEPCQKLDALITDPTFQRRVAAWRKRGLARIAKVYCNKQIELCERFGVTGSSGTEPGLPHVVWFKGGEEQEGKYEGGHSSLGDFDKWVFTHSMPHVLWFEHGKEAVAYDGNTSSVADFHKWVVAKEDVAERAEL